MNELEKELAAEHALLFSVQRQWRRDLIDGTRTEEGELARSAKEKGHAGNLAGIILRHISQHPVTVNHERGFASTELGDLTVSDVYALACKYFSNGLLKVNRQRKRVIVRISSSCIHSSFWVDDKECDWSKMLTEDFAEQHFEHYVGLCNRGLMSPEELTQKEEEVITNCSRRMPANRAMEIAQSVKDRFAKKAA